MTIGTAIGVVVVAAVIAAATAASETDFPLPFHIVSSPFVFLLPGFLNSCINDSKTKAAAEKKKKIVF